MHASWLSVSLCRALMALRLWPRLALWALPLGPYSDRGALFGHDDSHGVAAALARGADDAVLEVGLDQLFH